MALIQTVDSSDLYHLACKMGCGDNFGYNGWCAIGDYLKNLSDDLGGDIEIDIIAICCDYGMAEDVEDFASQHPDIMDDVGSEDWGDMDEKGKLDIVAEYIGDNGSLVVCNKDLIIWAGF